MAKTEAEINQAANRYYAKVFTMPTTPNREEQIRIAREEFGLPDLSEHRMVNVVRALASQFHPRTGVEPSPRAEVDHGRMQEYVDSLEKSDSDLLDKSA